VRARKFAYTHFLCDADVVTTTQPGLRERKKDATRKALREAALRLALENGPDNVRVDDIAEAAGVSPRTYNNYFASREQAIVAAVTADREARVAAAVAASPVGVPLSAAVTDAVVAQYTSPGGNDRDALALVAARPALREAFLAAAADITDPLAAVLAARLGGPGAQKNSVKKNSVQKNSAKDTGEHAAAMDPAENTGEVLAASVAAAVRIALRRWLQPAGGGLVVVSGSLPDLIRTALAPLAPALDAAAAR
jgi:AcrR family transcriptional regulator